MNEGKIYLAQKNKNDWTCFIFGNITNNYNKDFFQIIRSFEIKDKKYIFGILKIENIVKNYGLIEEYY